MIKKWLASSLLGIFGVLLIALISTPSSLFLFLSDSYFTLGILLLTIGLFGLILKQGTFDLFHYSLNKARNKLLQKQEKNKPNDDQLHRLSLSIPSFYTSFIKAGSLFLCCSLLCILVYYLLNT